MSFKMIANFYTCIRLEECVKKTICLLETGIEKTINLLFVYLMYYSFNILRKEHTIQSIL